jgi:competence protein ComEC
MKPARAAVCAIAVAVFLLVVPPRAPAVRAAVICWVFCASIMFRRHSNPVNTLSLAAAILLLTRPTQLFEAGWQLSFACVLAIILFTERIYDFILKQARRTGLRLRVFEIAGAIATKVFAAGLAALLGGAGILLYHFHTINPLTSIWTVLTFPIVSAILVLGFLKVIFFFVLPTLSGLLGLVVGLLSSFLILVVQVIAGLDVSQILIGSVSIVPIIAYYCAVVFAGYAHFRRPAIKRLICAAMFVSLAVYLGVLKYERTYRDDLVVTCLDVGHGQAILARLPGGTDILFDAGSLYGSNVGARIVTPFLDHQGIGGIDAVVISHNDTDHINGVPEIVASRDVGGVYANDAFFGKTDEWGTVAFLKECLSERDLEIEKLENCIRSGGASIRTLWPDEEPADTDDLSDNNRSLVSLIEFAGVGILLCSDIEQFAQAELLRKHPDLRADVVVVPHHGSTQTLDATFLDSLNAKVLICSCDRKQFERTISGTDPVVNASKRAKAFYTPRDGAVTVTVGTDGSIETTAFLK